MVSIALRFRSVALAVLLVAGAAVMPSGRALADSAADIDKMAESTLASLYAQKPSAARAVREAAGYAVFSDISTKILLAGGGGGKGVAVDNRSGAKTYMLMATVSAGLGLGISKSHLVWVFETREAFENFVNTGIELGANANLTVNPGAGGGLYDGAVEAAPGAWLYQLSDAGLAAELTVQGTKYFKDSNLN